MRGLASVLTVAFVFASASLLLGQAAGQSSDPSYPEEYRQPPPDAFIQGIVSDAAGKPVEGASVSSSSYSGYPGEPQPMVAEDSGSGTSSPDSIRCCYYGGYNSTMTGADGRFFLGVYSGENQLSVYHQDFVSRSLQLQVASGQTVQQDIQLEAYPEKTAHIIGKITDAKTGKGLSFASLNVRSPLYGLYECSQPEGTASSSTGTVEPAPDGEAKSSMPSPYYDSGCAITIHSDGSFEGDVTPGYSILSVYAWQDCSTTRDADGGGTTTCGPEYLQWTRTQNLAANSTTRIDIALQSRPSPDATVSGYLINVETGEAIPGAQISFSNQDTYAWGSATTDSDGSYKIRLRSGYHSVSVYANGFLSWEGVLQVKAGSSDFDVKLTPGQESWGGCCYAYADKAAGMEAVAPSPQSGSGIASATTSTEADGSDASSSGEQYQDLNGGLGPYNAAERSQAAADSGSLSTSDDKGAPAPGLLLALAALGAVLALRRRIA
ncbi:MAG: carboxypeptidase-like regulatory domain-containing protein [Candidatus Thermoplasmatota archaeon]|jgi:MYXO-CTERM domain-containing protein